MPEFGDFPAKIFKIWHSSKSSKSNRTADPHETAEEGTLKELITIARLWLSREGNFGAIDPSTVRVEPISASRHPATELY
jgi:hypothetical protein